MDQLKLLQTLGWQMRFVILFPAGVLLFKNNLKEVVEISTSQAVLVQGNSLTNDQLEIINNLRFQSTIGITR